MSPLVVALGSGALLACVSMLFRIEVRRGKRMLLARFREWLDRVADRSFGRMSSMHLYVGTGSFRAMFHYVLHGVIARLLRMSEWMGTHLKRLERRNRKMARQVRDAQTKSHLDLIAEHKATTALSAKEREALKQRSLEGDL